MIDYKVAFTELKESIKSDGFTSTSSLTIATALNFLISFSAIQKTSIFGSFAIFLILQFIITSFWLFARRIPSGKKNYINILVCIYADNNKSKPFKDDFERVFRKTLKESKISNEIRIHFISNSRAKSLAEDTQKIINIHNSKKYHLSVYGEVKERPIFDVNTHIVELNAYVTHRSLDKATQEAFASDITSGWVHRYNIQNLERNFQLTEITGNQIALASKYILASAASVSGSGEITIQLFNELIASLESLPGKQPPNIPIILRNSKKKRNLVLLSKAEYYISLWSKDQARNYGHIDTVEDVISTITPPENVSPRFRLTKAIVLVAKYHDFQTALKLIQRIKPKFQDIIWHADMAFITAAMGNYHCAIDHYKEIIQKKLTCPPEVIYQIEDFCLWYQLEHSDSPFTFLILGLLNHYLKGDNQRAIEDYSDFLRLADISDITARRKVETNISTLQRAQI